MSRQNIILLYDDGSRGAVLSGGSFEPELPLEHLLDPDLWRPARTTDLQLASTRFDVDFDAVYYSRAVVVGPSNLTPLYQYRITTYADVERTLIEQDTGWMQPAAAQGSPGTFRWGEDDYWLRNDHLGGNVIHVFPDVVPARYWTVEIDDQLNPDGHLDLGCLFMPLGWQPSMNMDYGATFGLKNNSLVSSTLAGGKKIWRRVNPRVLRVSLPILPEAEGFGQAYRFMQRVGFDGRVFAIPDPDDATTIHSRSFFGTITEMDALTQAVYGRVGAGFQIEETI